MNFVGHAEVARRIAGDDARFVLGAALPDLLPLVGLRLTRDDLPARIADGWRSHHRADETFHQLEVFAAGMGALRADLPFLGRGARRAVAHVGWELLLDDAVDGTALRFGLTASAEVSDDPGWRELVRRIGGARPPVAERVWRAVSRRPRLAFPPSQIDAVADALDRHAPAVAIVADEVLDAVANVP